nr:MAG TPA: hypothetical protein [Caudoviricetes sp.]
MLLRTLENLRLIIYRELIYIDIVIRKYYKLLHLIFL